MAEIPVLWSDEWYEIRPALNTDEFREMWWGFMQRMGWVRALLFYAGERRDRKDCCADGNM